MCSSAQTMLSCPASISHQGLLELHTDMFALQRRVRRSGSSVSPPGEDVELFLERQRDPGAWFVTVLYVALQRRVIYLLFSYASCPLWSSFINDVGETGLSRFTLVCKR